MKTFAVVAVAVGAIVAATPVLADSVQGKVARYDRVAKQLILKDQTVYSLVAKPDVAPASLSEGDEVRIVFTSPGDDGITSVDEIQILNDK